MGRNKKIKGLVLHCSASSFGSATLIKDWHVKGNGWSDIGYTMVVCNGKVENNTYMPFMDGAIEWGRDIDRDGAHTRGFNDLESICFIGLSGGFTINQLEAGRRVILHLIEKHGLDEKNIYGHSDLDDKKPFCPGIDVKKYVEKCIKLESLDEFVGLRWS
jgi:hypothetical protein